MTNTDKQEQLYKTYEIFTTNHSQIVQAKSALEAIEQAGNPDDLIGIMIADKPLPTFEKESKELIMQIVNPDKNRMFWTPAMVKEAMGMWAMTVLKAHSSTPVQEECYTRQDVINAWNSAYGGDRFSCGEDYESSLIK